MKLPKDNLFFGFKDKMTDEQKIYVDSIFNKKVIFVAARSGSGKTTLAVAAAKLIGKKLFYIFSPTQENKIGFRPGTTQEKLDDYIVPLKDALLEINEDPAKAIFNEEDLSNLKGGHVWVYAFSHVFARGINIKNKTVIIDEAQNFTKSELKKILTRCHDDCTIIIIGDPNQCDLNNPANSGFLAYLEHFKNEEYVAVCELTRNFRGVISAKSEELKC